MQWRKVIGKKGIQIGSNLQFITSDGRNYHFKLNRKEIRIFVKRNCFSEFKPGLITLPAIHEEGEFLLRYSEENKCFNFEGRDGCPYILNRALTQKSFLLCGDEVYLDYNQIRVSSQSLENKNEILNKYRWPADTPFLIEGETGTGKSSLALKLHQHFVGADNPFIAINLSALNPSLIESELFGHEKGAFTGAIKEKRGAVELAKNGTLFLDEMDSLDKSMQVKLLTFLDHLKYRRVGGEKELQTNCRIIFATGRNLKALVKEGNFRADLLYRIQSGVFEVLDPLRMRPELILEELKKFSQEKHILFDRQLAEFYSKCKWPGNFRQLHSHLKRKEMANFGSRVMSLCLLDQDLESFESESEDSLEQVKIEHCKKIFLASKGSISLASKRLQISKNTLKRLVA